MTQEDSLDKEPSDELRRARRLLEDIPGYKLLNDFYWDSKLNQWILHIQLTVDAPKTAYVPAVTRWNIIIDPQYPIGDIDFMPDAHGGIVHTFPHQNYNDLDDNASWRNGKVCLQTTQGSWGRKEYSAEPTNARERLKWNVIRCLSWLEGAAKGTLVKKGDPFELPAFPSTLNHLLIFNEDENSFKRWMSIKQKSGAFFYHSPRQIPAAIYFVDNFDSDAINTLARWGEYVRRKDEEVKTGAWIMLDSIPVIIPWQIPKTFGELSKVCLGKGVDLFQAISGVCFKLRKKNKILSVIMIGFPVSDKVEMPHTLIYWFALELPAKPKIKGYRENQVLWKRQLLTQLNASNRIKWIKTENWNRMQLTNRGKIDPKILESRILLIGAGALGSTMAELFARLGCSYITVVDPDRINAGNLSRHTLTLQEVGKSKAEALSARLNSFFPFHKCTYRKADIRKVLENEPTFFNQFDWIIDATGEDSVLNNISAYLSPINYFVSISTGYEAERMYCYLRSKGEPSDLVGDFKSRVTPILLEESSSIKEKSEIVEGIGCWHPLFPARIDDIQMLAGAAIKTIERHYLQVESTKLIVIEKQYDGANFIGLKVHTH